LRAALNAFLTLRSLEALSKIMDFAHFGQGISAPARIFDGD